MQILCFKSSSELFIKYIFEIFQQNENEFKKNFIKLICFLCNKKNKKLPLFFTLINILHSLFRDSIHNFKLFYIEILQLLNSKLYLDIIEISPFFYLKKCSDQLVVFILPLKHESALHFKASHSKTCTSR